MQRSTHARQIAARLSENLAKVQSQIAEAARRSGRPADAVRLVAVSKYVGPDEIAVLRELGVNDLGENRVQQLVQRAAALGADLSPGLGGAPSAAVAGPRWHMIGHLQRNKVKSLLAICRAVHSLDSARLARELAAQAEGLGVVIEVLVEVNLAGESAKTGAVVADLEPLVTATRTFPALRLCGLMTMAPLDPNPQAARPIFARLRMLRDGLLERGIAPRTCQQLSMGMTADFPMAIEEGATIVRIGSALFEGLAPAKS